MSLKFMWFQKDELAELKADIEKLIAQKASIDAKIEAINEKIIKIESQNRSKH